MILQHKNGGNSGELAIVQRGIGRCGDNACTATSGKVRHMHLLTRQIWIVCIHITTLVWFCLVTSLAVIMHATLSNGSMS